MKNFSEPVIGIIAEYNPLHNGHRLMMEAARSALNGAACVVALSSNFTQRGEPAIADKQTRTEMALTCGADLVLELPFPFACAAAPDFSSGGVDLLARTNLATHLAFGMEDPDRDIQPVLNILIHEPVSFKQGLQKELDSGASWPKAMALTLENLVPGSGAFVSRPNNMLALSYCLRIKRQGYGLVPLPLPRLGQGHGASTLGPFASAGAIRSAADRAANEKNFYDTGLNDLLSEAMPPFSLALLNRAKNEGRLCVPSEASKKLWPMLQALFIRSTPEDLRACSGVDEGLENLFLKHWRGSKGLDDFIGRCVSARLTRSRIRRTLLRLLSGMGRRDAQAVAQAGIPCARVLGFNDRGRELLRTRGRDSKIPIVSRPASAKDRGVIAGLVAGLEFRTSELYELLLPRPDLFREQKQKPVIRA